MKKILLLTLLGLFIQSCETTQPVVDEGPAPGYLVTADGKIDARDADPANLAIWEKYMDAHNERDYETIMSMNHDSIVLNLDDGRDIFGTDDHLAVLKEYIAVGNPTWEIYFSYTMKVDGQNGEWVIAGHRLNETIDGVESNPWVITDTFIVEGKIRRIIAFRKINN